MDAGGSPCTARLEKWRSATGSKRAASRGETERQIGAAARAQAALVEGTEPLRTLSTGRMPISDPAVRFTRGSTNGAANVIDFADASLTAPRFTASSRSAARPDPPSPYDRRRVRRGLPRDRGRN